VNTAASPRIAIASVGLGRIQRGYERYFSGIYESVRDEVDITIYKSAGPRNATEKVPALLGPAMSVLKFLPLGVVAGGAEYRAYKNDCLAFSLTLLPDLLRGAMDVVHVIDYPLAIALLHLRRLFRYGSRILFSDGGLMPPQYYPKADHVHVVAQHQFDVSLAWGHPPGYLTMVPCGFHSSHFSTPPSDRRSLRRKHNVSESTMVILAVSAVKRVHKRVHHIIAEAAQVRGDVLLWIDGKPEDSELVREARDKLGSRCRITHVPSLELPELYHLSDVFVHAALEEGFGLALCEAGSAGLTVLAHDSPHFRWLLGSERAVIDMSVPGPLARRLQELASMTPESRDRERNNAVGVKERFDWRVIAPLYAELYRKVSRGRQG